MMDYCENKVTFLSDNKEEIDKLHSIFSVELNEEDNRRAFGILIPEPNWEKIPNDKGELPLPASSLTYPSAFLGDPLAGSKWEIPNSLKSRFKILEFPDGTRDDRWSQWRKQNWGVKYCCDLKFEHLNLPNEFTVVFLTPYSPPDQIYNVIIKEFPNVKVSWFYDMPACEMNGYLENDNKISKTIEYEEGSKECRNLIEAKDSDDWRDTTMESFFTNINSTDLLQSQIKGEVYRFLVEISDDDGTRELLDEMGLDYKETEELQQGNILVDFTLDEDKYSYFEKNNNFHKTDFGAFNEDLAQRLGVFLFGWDLGFGTFKVTIYKPDGEVISYGGYG